MSPNLDGRVFKPVNNSDGGRVDSDTLFLFTQIGSNFTATYSGPNVTDGHLIGTFLNETMASIIYHSRAKTGELEAGQSVTEIRSNPEGRLTLSMKWVWLNRTKKSGTSEYIEVIEN